MGCVQKHYLTVNYSIAGRWKQTSKCGLLKASAMNKPTPLFLDDTFLPRVFVAEGELAGWSGALLNTGKCEGRALLRSA